MPKPTEGVITTTSTGEDPLVIELPRDPRWDSHEGRKEIAREERWLEYKHNVLNRIAVEGQDGEADRS